MANKFNRKPVPARAGKAPNDLGGSFTHTTEVGPTCHKHGRLHNGDKQDIMEIFIPERPDGSWPEVTATFCVRCFVDQLSCTIGVVTQDVKVIKP